MDRWEALSRVDEGNACKIALEIGSVKQICRTDITSWRKSRASWIFTKFKYVDCLNPCHKYKLLSWRSGKV